MDAAQWVADLGPEIEGLSPGAVIDRALSELGEQIAISFSGSEDVLLIELASQSGRPFRVFSIDTGRLHPETMRFFRAVEEHYGIGIEYCLPDSRRVEKLVRDKGLFSFHEDGHAECCALRKVEPLRRQLATLRGWITGQRRDQNPAVRGALPLVEVDPLHRGLGGEPLVKCNPLAALSSSEVWDALRAFEAPHNRLHERGYVSIGCEPCTRPVLPGQPEREGRWWWEQSGKKECGLHAEADED